MSEQTQEPHLSTDEILRIGRDFQKSDRWRGATFDTAKLLCDEIERLARRKYAKPFKWFKFNRARRATAK